VGSCSNHAPWQAASVCQQRSICSSCFDNTCQLSTDAGSPQGNSAALAAEQANTFEPAAEPAANAQHEMPKSMSAMMLPRAVALAKATALPLPASPVGATPGEAPARASGNAQVGLFALPRLVQLAC